MTSFFAGLVKIYIYIFLSQEKQDVLEKNAYLESLLVAEKEKFDKVVEKSTKLQEELAKQGLEKNELSTKLESEIASLK